MGKKVTKENKEYDYKKLVLWVLFWVALILIAALGVYITKFGVFLPLDTLGTLEQFGSFGDFIGGLMNPLLQFIVIAMLFWSIQVQRQELKATRDTLDATKVELLETKEANKTQAIELEKQTNILLTQQQDNLDHIRVEQELELLKRQRNIIEGLLLNDVSKIHKLSLKSVMNSSNQVRISDNFDFFDNTKEEWILGRKISHELQLFSTGLCGLLKCNNIPLSSALVEVYWLAQISNNLVYINVIKKELVTNIKENIINKIEESILSEENKDFFRDNLLNK